jgi:hypothetical protein
VSGLQKLAGDRRTDIADPDKADLHANPPLVIPGSSAGRNPEPMNTDNRRMS